MKNALGKSLFVGLAIPAAFVIMTCQSLQIREPVLSLQSVDLVDISFTGAELVCNINVENPNGIGIPLPNIDWEFFIGTNSFLKGNIVSGGLIGARRTTLVSVPVRITYLEMFNSILSLQGRNAVEFKVALDAKIPLPLLGEKIWHLEREGNFPVLRVPSVSFQGIDVKNLSLASVDFEVALEIENPNAVDMILSSLSYDLAVNNSQWASGRVQNAPRLVSGGKTVIPVSFSIRSLNIVRDVTQIVAGNSGVQYAFKGDLGFGLDIPGMKQLGSSVDFSGTTNLRR